MGNQYDNDDKLYIAPVSVSDFMLFMVDIFKENEIRCEVTAADELTVSDEGCSFVLKISEG